MSLGLIIIEEVSEVSPENNTELQLCITSKVVDTVCVLIYNEGSSSGK